MIIRKLKSVMELRDCVSNSIELYNDPFFPADKDYALRSILQAKQEGALIRVIEDKEKIVGWGIAALATPWLHSPDKQLSQLYYHTTLDGIKAVKALRLFHKEMVEYARKYKIRKCTTSSMLDNQETFYRILEKDGWIRRGCLLVYPLRF
jgi:hypothetical protein